MTFLQNTNQISPNEKMRVIFIFRSSNNFFYSQASILYPGRYVGLYWNVTSADVSSRSNEMTATIGGRVYVNADNANASDVIFSGLFVSKI